MPPAPGNGRSHAEHGSPAFVIEIEHLGSDGRGVLSQLDARRQLAIGERPTFYIRDDVKQREGHAFRRVRVLHDRSPLFLFCCSREEQRPRLPGFSHCLPRYCFGFAGPSQRSPKSLATQGHKPVSGGAMTSTSFAPARMTGQPHERRAGAREARPDQLGGTGSGRAIVVDPAVIAPFVARHSPLTLRARRGECRHNRFASPDRRRVG